jgi:uncharacterized protein (TIGR02611 family)
MKKHLARWSRKVAVAIAGTVVLVIGIILIPLPGPGILVCLGALWIFSLEFQWSKKYFEKGKRQFQEALNKARQKSDY